MRTGKWWMGASLGMILMLAPHGLQAQDPIGGARSHVSVPIPNRTIPGLIGEPAGNSIHDGHHDHHDHHVHHEEYDEHEVEEDIGLFGNADFLLVRPRRRPHSLVIVDPNNNLAIDGQVVNFDWSTVAAYRVGLGYRLGHGWEVGGVYTYVHSNDQIAVGRPPNGALYATLSAPFSFDSGDAVIGSSNLDMDLIDVELARRFVLLEGLELRLVSGSRIATIQQKTEVAYDFRPIGLGISNVNNRIQFDGAGLRLGGEGFWRMGGTNLGLHTKAFTSLISGEFKTNLNQFVNDGRAAVIAVDDRFRKVVPVTELGVGFGWRSENVSLVVGYELQNFFGMVDTIDFGDDGSFKPNFKTGDLSLEALTVSLGFRY